VITTTLTPDGHLRLQADAESREALRGEEYPRQERMVADELRDHGHYEFIEPVDILALTDAPILCHADDQTVCGDGTREFVAGARFYWFPSYMVRNPWDDLAEQGEVTFRKAE
jgi:hypothetical protein